MSGACVGCGCELPVRRAGSGRQQTICGSCRKSGERGLSSLAKLACVHCGAIVPWSPDRRRLRVHAECSKLIAAAALSEKNARRRAVEVGGDLTRADVTRMRREASECAICGCALTASGRALPTSAQLDHVVPLAIGGAHSRENTRIVCRSCNLSRPKDGSDLPLELVERMTELQRRLFREAKERSAAEASRRAAAESEAARRRALACSRRGYASTRALRASVQPAQRDPGREALLDRVSELRARGLGYKAIGRELGLSRERARDAVRTVERRARVA